MSNRIRELISKLVERIPSRNKEHTEVKQEFIKALGVDTKPIVKKPRNKGKYHNLIKR